VAGVQPQTVIVQGVIRSAEGEPLAFANVFFTDGLEGAMASSQGEFVLVVMTFGKRTLSVSYLARETIERTIAISPGDSVFVEIVLGDQPTEMEEIVTTASTYSIGDDEDVSLTSLEVVRTPGAAGDIFRALQTFPGIIQVDEGAGLFVRGGDVSEVLTLLDGATIAYPYRYS
jgi:hypothetical protein